ncbi:hypothetical protein Rsub_05565 [Raphidocelis subcapitata]|uniref:Protein kinase domain-containing protein n=1 Tax=Raphidocelis subcapitata TaxID=307507 RepID=A0A2V0P3D4_9CHLO|nr:hypothetical protein Rsub_05565 [Raphidocelis subcapitata]|eukprot:GBF92363.1 hypothetical protein Rsub_05565 [Raphidocelis subcapitata]
MNRCWCISRPRADEAAGPDLSPYRVLRPIGRGAVGDVYLARHAGDGALYAVKTVPLSAPSWRLELLKREERVYASLATDAGAHVNLLRPCRMQLLPDRLALVTEWASGGTLATFLAARRFARGADEAFARFVMRQLVAAVERLHTHRVAARDIKLDNILVDTTSFGARAPRVLLADFGTCKAWEEGEPGCLTQTFMGTPGFMAPQILRLLSLQRDGSAPPPPPAPRAAAPAPAPAAPRPPPLDLAPLRVPRSGSQMDDSAAMSSASDSSSGLDSDSDSDSLASLGAAAASPAAAAAAGPAGGFPAGGSPVGGSPKQYDAVKADIYSLGAILMYMLFKELPFGFDKFSRLLPPREALTVLWTLESSQSWREAAGAGLMRRHVAPEALDLLDQMLSPSESMRIDIPGIKAHPWLSARLPRRLQGALDEMAREQSDLDAARRACFDRSARRRRASLEAAGGAAAAAQAAAAAPAAPAPARGGSGALAARSRPLGAVEVALEQLFAAAADPSELRSLRERGVSLFVDVTPDGVADAWERGLQSEPLRPARRGERGGGGRSSAGSSPRALAPPRPPPAAAPPPLAPAGGAAWEEEDWGGAAGGEGGARSVAGRSDSATSTDLPALGGRGEKRPAAAAGGAAAASPFASAVLQWQS